MIDLPALEARLAVPALADVVSEDDLAGLPEPAARYLRHAAPPGTPIARAARIEMAGRIRIGRWLRFRAREVLAPLEGFVWSARVGGVIVGSDHYADGEGALDWRLLGRVPLVHAEGADVSRSAAGRAAGEAAWLPTVLLPRFGAEWRADDDRHATVTFAVDGQEPVDADLVVGADGELLAMTYRRWGDPDGAGTFGWHDFRMTAEAEGDVAGMRVPVAGRVGWGDTDFFHYEITSLAPVPSACGAG
ncbi:DUF6544 family protein [Actinomarinicola tropica]|uniref:Uncharacterized protein n=1 Tax=Actinomarinicola tropica TaxID=2789776 RepID=A0A5Q2RJQ9_9ACTN|nr:DUF6544 family protein [Actinomarinicola tropica]QGG94277.1 hypothetical protein GH723_03720 [Actinomarinicola tropica]